MGVSWTVCDVCKSIVGEGQHFGIKGFESVYACDGCKYDFVEDLEPEESSLEFVLKLGETTWDFKDLDDLVDFVNDPCLVFNNVEDPVDQAIIHIIDNEEVEDITITNMEMLKRDFLNRLVDKQHYEWLPTERYVNEQIDKKEKEIKRSQFGIEWCNEILRRMGEKHKKRSHKDDGSPKSSKKKI